MKFLIIFALALATVSAELVSRSVVVPTLEDEIFSRSEVMPTLENEGRITNGQTATTGQFPYQVGLSLRMNLLMSSWCGGSLISSTWVLSAAHCTVNIQSVIVYLGATARLSAQVTHTVAANQIINHAQYNSRTLVNDISLIRIPSTATTARISPVALPAIGVTANFAGETGIASGWGRISDAATGVTNNLQWARMPIITNAVCQRTFGSTVTASNICVSTDGGISTCQGDSGGPLVLASNNMLVGVVSFGSAAGCTRGAPAAFARVTSFRNWIRTNSGV